MAHKGPSCVPGQTSCWRSSPPQVLPFGASTALLCASMHVPDPGSFRDSMIAATAREHGLILVTRNVDDFERLGISILNPWEAAK